MRQGKASFKFFLMNSWHVNQVHGGAYQSQKTSLCPAGSLLKGVAVYPRLRVRLAVERPWLYICTPPYHPGRYQETMEM